MDFVIGMIVGAILAWAIPIIIFERLAFGGKWWTEGERESGKE